LSLILTFRDTILVFDNFNLPSHEHRLAVDQSIQQTLLGRLFPVRFPEFPSLRKGLQNGVGWLNGGVRVEKRGNGVHGMSQPPILVVES
jgi:hypothetical protein